MYAFINHHTPSKLVSNLVLVACCPILRTEEHRQRGWLYTLEQCDPDRIPENKRGRYDRCFLDLPSSENPCYAECTVEEHLHIKMYVCKEI